MQHPGVSKRREVGWGHWGSHIHCPHCVLLRLSPYSHDRDSLSSSQDHIPLAALPLLATSSGSYQHAVGAVIARANQAYSAFLHSGEGAGFCGQVRGDLGKALLWAAAGVWLRGAPRFPCVEGLGVPSFLALSTGACSPQVVLLGDCVGGILGFDALCQSRAGSGGSRSSSRRGSLVSASTLPLVREGGKGGSRPWVLGCGVGRGAGGG